MIETVHDLLRALGAVEPPVFIFGGVGEDAVLDGALTRPHSDVDVLIPRHELDLRLAQFRDWGYEEWETWLADGTGRPQVLHSHGHPVELEISVLEGEPGDYSFAFPDPAGGHAHFHLPADEFDHPAVTIEGIPVRTVSAESLWLVRQALIEIGSFGELRPKDIPVQARLREMLGDALPAPRITRA